MFLPAIFDFLLGQKCLWLDLEMAIWMSPGWFLISVDGGTHGYTFLVYWRQLRGKWVVYLFHGMIRVEVSDFWPLVWNMPVKGPIEVKIPIQSVKPWFHLELRPCQHLGDPLPPLMILDLYLHRFSFSDFSFEFWLFVFFFHSGEPIIDSANLLLIMFYLTFFAAPVKCQEDQIK